MLELMSQEDLWKSEGITLEGSVLDRGNRGYLRVQRSDIPAKSKRASPATFVVNIVGLSSATEKKANLVTSSSEHKRVNYLYIYQV